MGVLHVDKKRLYFLDELRGFAILCMVFYHAFYDMADIFGWSAGRTLLNFFMPVEPIFAGVFILISGIVSRFSRSNCKRGLKLLGVAVLVTAVTYAFGYFTGLNITIWFGILHLLSLSMLIFAGIRPLLDKVPVLLGIILTVVLFAVTYSVPTGKIGLFGIYYTFPESIRNASFLFPVGIPGKDFYSSDYFPIIPWLFLFICGTFLGVWAKAGRFPLFFYKKRVRFFGFLGHHSLLIYVVHQPVIYGILFLIKIVFSL